MSGGAFDRDADGYRRTPVGGPALRTDIVEVYVFRAQRMGDPEAVELLQLERAKAPLAGDWHPIMGHIEEGETSIECARRELEEEIGLRASDPAFLGFWALEQVHPFYLPEIECIVASPRFAAHVAIAFEPTLDEESTGARWVKAQNIDSAFTWPGQKRACAEILTEIVRSGSLAAERLRLPVNPE